MTTITIPSELIPKTDQAAQFAQFMQELVAKVEKIGVSLAGFDPKVFRDMQGHAADIAKLRDDVEAVKADAGKRLAKWIEREKSGTLQSAMPIEMAQGIGKLCLAISNKDHVAVGELQKAAVTPGSGTSGGFLMNEEFINLLIRNVENYGNLAQAVGITRTRELKGRLPRRTGGATVYYPDIGVAPTESSGTLAQENYELLRYSAATYADRWMLRTSQGAAIANWLLQELSYAINVAIDTNLSKGDGTSTYARVTGILNKSYSQDVTADTGDNTFAEVCDASVKYVAALPGGFMDSLDSDLQWIMHRTVFFRFMAARDTQNRPVVDMALIDGKPRMTLFGYPVQIAQAFKKLSDTANSTPLAAMSALSRGWAIFMHEAGVELRESEHHKFLEGYLSYVSDALIDIKEVDPQCTGRLITAAS